MRGSGKQRGEPGTTLAWIAPDKPEPPERSCHFEPAADVTVRRSRPPQCSAQVVMLGLQAVARARLLVSQLGRCFVRQREEEREMPLLPPRFFASLAESIPRILLYRDQDAVAR